jgi:hypothetical protein
MSVEQLRALMRDAGIPVDELSPRLERVMMWAVQSLEGAQRVLDSDYACGFYRGQAQAFYESAWLVMNCPHGWPSFPVWSDRVTAAITQLPLGMRP